LNSTPPGQNWPDCCAFPRCDSRCQPNPPVVVTPGGRPPRSTDSPCGGQRPIHWQVVCQYVLLSARVRVAAGRWGWAGPEAGCQCPGFVPLGLPRSTFQPARAYVLRGPGAAKCRNARLGLDAGNSSAQVPYPRLTIPPQWPAGERSLPLAVCKRPAQQAN
jgi:hypothetical protein